MLEVKFIIDFNYLQCIPRNTFTHNEKPRFFYNEANKALTGSMATNCMQILWNLGEEATMYILFPTMFLEMGFGYTHVHRVFGLD
jgi:hypothetical protein